MAHPLTRYLEERGEKLYAFAKRAKLPGTSLARALSGQRGLSLEMAFRIEEVTSGKVPARSWRRIKRGRIEARNGTPVTDGRMA